MSIVSTKNSPPSWPRNGLELLTLPEVEYTVYLKHREVRAGYPAGTMTQWRDLHGDLWRAVDLEELGMRRVKIG